MKKEAAIIILFLVVVYLSVVAAASLTQGYVIFQSRGAATAPPAHLPVSALVLPTPDGERLNAWWLQTGGATRTVLYFQGNGTNISHKGIRLRTFYEMGVNALLVDYRGYGKSTGRIKTERDIYTDGLTAWSHLTIEKGISAEDIIIWGRSLGGGVAAEVAQFRNISALILESTFCSLNALARRQYWFLPTGRLLKFDFDNAAKLKNVRAPIVIVHSVDDDYIPFTQAARLYAAAPAPRYLIRTNGSHLDWFERDGRALAELIHRLALAPKAPAIH